MTKGIHWLRHDQRLAGNEALIALSKKVDALVVVYVFDPRWQQVNQFGFTQIGEHRLRFLQQSLFDLKHQLKFLNIQLLLLSGKPESVISQVICDTQADVLSYEFHTGFDEQKQVEKVLEQHPQLEVIVGSSNYLYALSDFPFAMSNMPDGFTSFRKKVEKYCEVKISNQNFVKKTQQSLSIDCSEYQPFDFKPEWAPQVSLGSKIIENNYIGGNTSAMLRINNYFFESNFVASYKETRNGLDGWDFSSRLSAFLALGCVSPRQIVEKLRAYESTVVKNDSTYWLFFELLWREFFHWQHHKHKHKFFQKQGLKEAVSNIPSKCKHDQNKLNSWINGETGYPIVNACMKQLAATGFMSNRGRQLVASCLVHELGLDWRYGAAYFEQELIDFDVASNFGNWQYLAGVGCDPRGLRQFNLQKQSQIYDPHGEFIKKWA